MKKYQTRIKLGKAGMLIMLISLFSTSIGFAQDSSWVHKLNEGKSDFFDVLKTGMDYYKNNPSEMSETEDSDFNNFGRFQTFWRSRVKCDLNGFGDMSYAPQAMVNYLNTPYCNNTSSTQQGGSDWIPVGPNRKPHDYSTSCGAYPELHAMGRVNALWVHPNDPNIILAGAHHGGIFKATNNWYSTDEEPHWRNVTDINRLYGAGITFFSSTRNAQVIYASTGPDLRGGDYGIGILKSTNFGDSWFLCDQLISGSPPSPAFKFKKVLVHPTNPDFVVAMTTDEVYFSTTGGIGNGNWVLANPSGVPQIAPAFWDMEFVPFDINNPSSPIKLILGGKELWVLDLSNLNNPVWTMKSGFLTGNYANALLRKLTISVPEFNTENDFIYICYPTDQSNDLEPNSWEIDKISGIDLQNNAAFTSHFVKNLSGGQGSTNACSYFEVSKQDDYVFYFETGARTLEKTIIGSSSNTNEITEYWSTCGNLNNKGHADIRAILIYESTIDGLNDKVFVGEDGGLLFSEVWSNQGRTPLWKDLNGNGMNITQFYSETVMKAILI